jgi:hypothetical protein
MALEETPDLYGAYPRLEPEQIERLSPLGVWHDTQAGEVLHREGRNDHNLIVILEGKVAIVEGYGSGGERASTCTTRGASWASSGCSRPRPSSSARSSPSPARS